MNYHESSPILPVACRPEPPLRACNRDLVCGRLREGQVCSRGQKLPRSGTTDSRVCQVRSRAQKLVTAVFWPGEAFPGDILPGDVLPGDEPSTSDSPIAWKPTCRRKPVFGCKPMWTRFEGDSLSESNHEPPRRFCGEHDPSVSDSGKLVVSRRGPGLPNFMKLCLLDSVKGVDMGDTSGDVAA